MKDKLGKLQIPDLRGRFILGGNTDANKLASLGKYDYNSTGGAEKHTLSIDEMPSHTHYWCGGGGGGGIDGSGPANWDGNMSSNCQYQRINVKPTGNNQPHNNMPPYYVLAYIYKL